MGFVRNVKYFCGKEYFETDLFEMPGMSARGKRLRERKINLSSPDQVRRNKNKALRTFRQKVRTNFTRNDIYLTLTYAAEHRPDSVKSAKNDFKNFIRRLNRRRKKAGLEAVKYMGTLERKSENYHFHLVISGDMDRDELERIWGKGLSNASRLRIDDEELMQKLCQYILKESRNKDRYENSYICSRNLENPKVTKNDWAFSHRKLEELAGLTDCREVWETIYTGYEFIEATSTFNMMTGWHITVKMTKRREKHVYQKNKRVRLHGAALRKLNDAVHERDEWKCINCGQYVDNSEKIHHEPCGVYKSDEITKAVTLCRCCHYIRHHTGDAAKVREKCVNYLRALYGDLGAKKE